MLKESRTNWFRRNVLETPAPFNSTGSLMLGASLSDSARRGFPPSTTTRQIENWEMREVTLFPALGLVFKERQSIERTRFCVFPGEEGRGAELLKRASS